ncbi:MAG: hypothetical protein WCH46_00170 [bacterium]
MKVSSFLLLVSLLTFTSLSFSQTSDTSSKLKFYLACENCDFDFIRKEISFVDYVRDPAQADVHCFVVRESAGNGGARYSFIFLGLHQFSGVNDTLQLLNKVEATQDEFRSGTVRVLTLGLTRYVSHTSQASELTVSCKVADSAVSPTVDSWDSWIFALDINSNINLEQQHGYYNYYAGISANRTTPDWKIRTNSYLSYTENKFDDLGIKSLSRSSSFEGLVVRSLTDHWSTGPSVTLGSNTYRNRKFLAEGSWGLEYDIFPYSESTARQLRILYKLGANKYNYFDTTIYDKVSELVGSQVLSASLVLQQSWGTAELTVAGSQYLHDLSQTEFNVFTNMQLRLFEGLSLRIYGNYAAIHDQIFLPKTGLSNDEVLLQLHQLKTNYAFYTSLGLTYTFGSIYNNVVNPRFGN